MQPDTPSTPIAWTDAFLLGYTPMDDTHREFVERVSALQAAGDADVARCLEAFAVHARRHFEEENQWMVDTDFPPRECHIDEHAAVMKSVEQVQVLVAGGNFDIARELANQLAHWFPGHADYLDAALSHWMSKRRWDAKPVVVRRGILATP